MEKSNTLLPPNKNEKNTKLLSWFRSLPDYISSITKEKCLAAQYDTVIEDSLNEYFSILDDNLKDSDVQLRPTSLFANQVSTNVTSCLVNMSEKSFDINGRTIARMTSLLASVYTMVYSKQMTVRLAGLSAFLSQGYLICDDFAAFKRKYQPLVEIFREDHLIATSSFGESLENAATQLDWTAEVIDTIAKYPNKFRKSLTGKAVSRFVTFMIYTEFVPDKLRNTFLFFNLYDKEIQSDLDEGVTLKLITESISAATQIIRSMIHRDIHFGDPLSPIHFVNEVQWLDRTKHALSNDLDAMGQPPKGKFSQQEWVNRIERAYANRNKISRETKTTLYDTGLDLVRRYVLKLDELWTNVYRKIQLTANVPLVIGLTGEAGSGKTTRLAPHISKIALSAMGHNVGALGTYHADLNLDDPYLSAWKNGIKSVTLDEFKAYKEANPNNVLNSQLLQMLDGSGVMLNRAELSEKGNVIFNPEVIIPVSNDPGFGLSSILVHQEAGWRRFTEVFEVKIKTNFRKEGGAGIDLSKLNEAQDRLREEYANKFDSEDRLENFLMGRDEFHPIKVARLKRHTDGFCYPEDFKEENDCLSVPEFFDLIATIARNHKVRLDKDEKSASRMNDFGPCDKCNKFACECPFPEDTIKELQAKYGPEDDASTVHGSDIESEIDNEEYDSDAELELDSVTQDLLEDLEMVGDDLMPTSGPALQPPSSSLRTLFFFNFVALYFWSYSIVLGIMCFLIDYTDFGRKYFDKLVRKQIIVDFELAAMSVCNRSSRSIGELQSRLDAISKKRYAKQIVMGIAPILFIASATGIAYKIWSLTKSYRDKYVEEENITTTSGLCDDVLKRHNPKALPGKINPWCNSEYEMRDYRVSLASSANMDIYEKNILKNTYQIVVGEKQDSVYVIGIHSTFFLTVSHIFDNAKETDKVYFCNRYAHCGQITHNVITETTVGSIIRQDLGNDRILLYLPDLAPVKDIRNFIIEDNGTLGYTGYLEGRSYAKVDGKEEIIKSESTTITRKTRKYGKYKYPGYLGNFSENSFLGMCGVPLILKIRNQHSFVGINTAGVPNTSLCFFSPITKAELEDAEKALMKKYDNPLVPTSSDFSTLPYLEEETGLFDEKSLFWWIPGNAMGGLTYLFSIVNQVVPRMKSAVRNSFLRSSFEINFPEEFHSDCIAPDFSRGVNYEDPMYINIQKIARPAHSINDNDLRDVINHLVNKWSALPGMDSLDFISPDEAINGIPGKVKSMDKRTAAGEPFGGKKIDHLIEREDGTYCMSERLEKEVDTLFKSYMQGKRYNSVYKALLKDEPRSRKKVEERRLRMFTAGSLAQFIVHKCIFASFMNAFLANFVDTETVCGINCFGPDWAKVRNKLMQFKLAVNGDYKSYDKMISAKLIMAAMTIMYKIIFKGVDPSLLKKFTSPEHFRDFFNALATDIAYPIIKINKDVCMANGSISSGLLLTLILNNIINSILIRLNFLHNYREQLREKYTNNRLILLEFEDNVSFIALGDDNTFTVSDNVKTWFHFRNIQSYFASIGITYTNADKSNDVYELVPVEDCTIGKRIFVERTFVIDGEEKTVVTCPIEKRSIGKMLSLYMEDGPLTPKTKMRETLRSIWYEFAQYGPEEFNINSDRLRQTILDAGDEYGFLLRDPFPTFEEVFRKILRKDSVPWNIVEDEESYTFISM